MAAVALQAEEAAMAQLSRISKNNTKIYKDEEGRINQVWLHNTCILEIDWNKRVFRWYVGGWNTVTSQTRMNQAFNQLGIPHCASRKGGVFRVASNSGTNVPEDAWARF